MGSLSGRSILCDRLAPASTSCNRAARPSHAATHVPHTSRLQQHRASIEEPRRVAVKAVGEDDAGEEEEESTPKQRGGRGAGRRRAPKQQDEGPQRDADGFEERVLQVSRVTKVVKGGKVMSFRAVVAVGDDKGRVGVGCAAAKEVVMAVEKAALDAKKHVISVPITRGLSFPHRVNGIAGGAKVMLRPASQGTGVIAGGAVREILELSGIKNGFGKQLGSDNPLNNARATIDGLSQLRTLGQAAANRGMSVEQMLHFNQDSAVAA